MLKIKELREDTNLQQKDVAAKLNRTTACISSWETGKTEPSIEDIIRLADLFGVSCDYLLGRTNDFEAVDPFATLSPAQREMLGMFDMLTREDQYRVLGYAQALAK